MQDFKFIYAYNCCRQYKKLYNFKWILYQRWAKSAIATICGSPFHNYPHNYKTMFFFFLRINYKTMYMMLTSCHKSLDENWPWWILVWLLLPHLLSFLHYLFQLEHLSLSFSLSHRNFILRTWKKLKLSHVPLKIMVPFSIRVPIYVFNF